jgi:prepilin-type N-terminal cleavage/methylation domain-containing protein
MNRRRGFTLIEMLVVIVVSTALAGCAVLLLYALRTNHDVGRKHLEYCRTINRLAEQFRADVHSMQKTAAQDKETGIDLLPAKSGDGSNITAIRYEFLEDRIDRSQLRGDELVSLESYMLGPDKRCSLNTVAERGATFVGIEILPDDQAENLLRAMPQRIEAELGRDARLSHRGPGHTGEGKP